MTTAQVVGYCLTAFGLGYAAGALKLYFNRAVETLD